MTLVTDSDTFFTTWPATTPDTRADVLLVHGFGEHSGRYEAIVRWLPGHGFAVHGFDLPGHGRSGGRRGHVDSWSEYRDSVTHALQRASDPSRPMFLLGHSMGGLIVLDWLLEAGRTPMPQVDGAILSAAAIIPLEVGKPWQIAASRAVSRVWPTFSMNVPIGAVSRDPTIIAALRADALNHRRASARWATEGLAAIARVRAGVHSVKVPVLVVHGQADRVIDIAGSRWLLEHLGSNDTEVRTYPNAYHEVHNDPARDALLTDVVSWLERHV